MIPYGGIVNPATVALISGSRRDLNGNTFGYCVLIFALQHTAMQPGPGHDKYGMQLVFIGRQLFVVFIVQPQGDCRIQGVADTFLGSGILQRLGDLAPWQ